VPTRSKKCDNVCKLRQVDSPWQAEPRKISITSLDIDGIVALSLQAKEISKQLQDEYNELIAEQRREKPKNLKAAASLLSFANEVQRGRPFLRSL
jgi:hypothetical protein